VSKPTVPTSRIATPRPPAPRVAPRTTRRFGGPLFSTIDKYVLSSFLKNYVISFFVLIGLYVVLDMVFNFDEFVQVSGREAGDDTGTILQTIHLIASFYFFQAFRIFNYLAGVIPVVATAFTLMRMSRFNELTALLAAGRPLLRVAAPIIGAALALNIGLLLVNQEVIVPRLIDRLTRDRGQADSSLDNRVLRAMPDGADKLLFAGRYTPATEKVPALMEVVDVLSKVDGKQTHLTADRATFDASANVWKLENGSLAEIVKPGQGRGADPVPQAAYNGDGVNPETIALFLSRGDFVDLLSTSRISELLAQNTGVGRIDLMRVRDARWANYVLNIVLVLLTIPCVLTREPMQLRTAAGRVLLLVGACMGTIFVCQSIAGQPPPNPQLASMWTAAMAWLPIFIYCPIAVWLLDRLKT
jgi:lipopolysaccharide export LptBFGC system permease protein LptF